MIKRYKELENLESRINDYKDSMINIFKIKYGISEFNARKQIEEYDFDNVLEYSDYIVLHDNPEIWVDAIYQYNKDKTNPINSLI